MRTNKPIRNFQKKKYYTNKNVKTVKTKHDPWLDGTFAIDPQTWEVKHTPK